MTGRLASAWRVWFVAAAGLLAICAGVGAGGTEVPVDVEFMVTNRQDCRLTVEAKGEGNHGTAVTSFRADRLNAEGKYIRGTETGGITGASIEGTYVMEEDVFDDGGTVRLAKSDDPPEKVARFTRTFSLTPNGHCTFFHGVLRKRGTNQVMRQFTWGYPLGTVCVKEPPADPLPDEEPKGGKL